MNTAHTLNNENNTFSDSSSVGGLHVIKVPNHAIHLELQLRKSKSIPAYLKLACIKAFIQHLLFVKKMIPYTHDHVLHEYYEFVNLKEREEEQGMKFDIHVDYDHSEKMNGMKDSCNNHTGNSNKRKRKDMTTQRKIIKCGEQLHLLYQDLKQILLLGGTCTTRNSSDVDDDDGRSDDSFVKKYSHWNHDDKNDNDEGGVKAVLLTIGPSFHSPREQYLIQFHSWPSLTTCITANSTSNTNIVIPPKVMQKNEHEISRRIIREYITGMYDYETNQNHLHMKQLQEFQKQLEEQNMKKKQLKQQQQQQHQHEYKQIKNIHNRRKKKTQVNINQLYYRNINKQKTNIHPQIDTSVGNLGCSASNLKLYVTCLVSQHHMSQLLLQTQQQQKQKQQCHQNQSSNPQPYQIERGFVVKVPRMINKKRNIHRPFVIMNVKPMMNPVLVDATTTTTTSFSAVSNNTTKCNNNEPICQQDNNDIWLSLKSKVKGFVKR